MLSLLFLKHLQGAQNDDEPDRDVHSPCYFGMEVQ